MMDDDRQTHPNANIRLHGSYGRYFRSFTAAAAVVHALLLVFFVAPRGESFESTTEELEVVDMLPELEIPPPPEEMARPAMPVMSEERVEEDITIAETVITENEPVPEAPPPSAADDPGDTFTLTPHTVTPRCLAGCTAEDILRHVPSTLKRSGVSCSLTMGIRIDTSGNVTATDLLKSSGNDACDTAARQWARTTRWSTAYNRDQGGGGVGLAAADDRDAVAAVLFGLAVRIPAVDR